MAEFYKTTTIWVVDFLYEGHPRRWYKPAGPGVDPAAEAARTLHEWYGERARVVAVHEATDEELARYLRGDEPKNVYCPTGRMSGK